MTDDYEFEYDPFTDPNHELYVAPTNTRFVNMVTVDKNWEAVKKEKRQSSNWEDDYGTTFIAISSKEIESLRITVKVHFTKVNENAYMPGSLYTTATKHVVLFYTDLDDWRRAQPGGHAKSAMRNTIRDITDYNRVLPEDQRINFMSGMIVGGREETQYVKNVSILVVFYPDGDQQAILFVADPQYDGLPYDKYTEEVEEIVIDLAPRYKEGKINNLTGVVK